MSQSLPTPGGDVGTWGTMLNGFLDVSHNADGSLNTSAVSTAGAEMTSNKNQASGYAGLNSSTQVPVALLGSGSATTSTYLRGDGSWQAVPSAPNATAGATGLVQLAGDLGGSGTTATAPTLAATSNVESIISANTTVSGALQKTGGTMSGTIAMGSNKITGLTNGSISSDAAAFGQIPVAGTTSGTYAAGNDSRIVNAESALTPLSSPVTTTYTANPGDVVPVNAAGGAVTVKLPNAPADKSRVVVKLVSATSTTNVASIQTQGSDVIDVSGGATTASLILKYEARTFQYQASNAIWYVLDADFPLGSLATGSITSVSTTYSILGTDHVILADATSASFTITLPTAVGFSGIYVIKAVDSTNTNVVMVQTTSSQTVDGAAPPLQLGGQLSGTTWQMVSLVSDGSNWRISTGVPNGSSTVTTSMLVAGGFGSSAGNAITPVYVGSPASSTMTSGSLFYVQVDIPWPRTITGVGYFVGGTAITGSNVITSGIYNSAGSLKASTSSAVPQSGTSRAQLVAFSSAYSAAAGTYFIALGNANAGCTAYQTTTVLAPSGITATFGAVTSTITIPSGFVLPGTNFPMLWFY